LRKPAANAYNFEPLVVNVMLMYAGFCGKVYIAACCGENDTWERVESGANYNL